MFGLTAEGKNLLGKVLGPMGRFEDLSQIAGEGGLIAAIFQCDFGIP